MHIVQLTAICFVGRVLACELDLAGLAKGGYVVRIATPLGTAAQKLAVE